MISPILTGDPDHHIIEDMWLGVTVASQGPAGRVLVSEGLISSPPSQGGRQKWSGGDPLMTGAFANVHFCFFKQIYLFTYSM